MLFDDFVLNSEILLPLFKLKKKTNIATDITLIIQCEWVTQNEAAEDEIDKVSRLLPVTLESDALSEAVEDIEVGESAVTTFFDYLNNFSSFVTPIAQVRPPFVMLFLYN